jgi:hypothetical protein
MKLSLLFQALPFETERVVCSKVNAFLGRRPSSGPFLSGDGFRLLADHLHDETADLNPAELREAQVVFVSSYRLDEFMKSVLPRINCRFVLITHQGDTEIDYAYMDIAESPKLIHWFCQNAAIEHDKLTPLPIGLEDQWRHNAGVKGDFRRLSRRKPERKPGVVVAFTLSTNPDERFKCYRAFWRTERAVEFSSFLCNALYRRELQKYMFVASPPGNGLDCHRTWEAMYLGVVPIVLDNVMNRYFASLGLPMVCVKDWREPASWTREHLEKLYRETQESCDRTPLYIPFWRTRIKDVSRRAVAS